MMEQLGSAFSRRAFLKLAGLFTEAAAANTRAGQLFAKIVRMFFGQEERGDSKRGVIEQSDALMEAGGPPVRFYSQEQFEQEMAMFLEFAERFPIVGKLNKLRHLVTAYQQRNFERYKVGEYDYVPAVPQTLASFLKENARRLFSEQELPFEQASQRIESTYARVAGGLTIESDGVLTDASLLMLFSALFPGERGTPPEIPISPNHKSAVDYILKNPVIRDYYGECENIQDLLRKIATSEIHTNMKRWQFPNGEGEMLELEAEPFTYSESDTPLWPDRKLIPGTVIIVASPDNKAVHTLTIVGKIGAGQSAKYLTVGVGIDSDSLDRETRRRYGQIQFSVYSQDHLLQHISDTNIRRAFTIQQI